MSPFLTKFEYALRSLKHQIAVQTLMIRPEHPDHVLAILPYLRPGYLEDILIDDGRVKADWKSDENVRKVEQIMQLDQWKQAEELYLQESLDMFPDEVFVQFKKYWILALSLSENQLTRIGFMFAESPIFEHCEFVVEGHDNYHLISSIGVPGPPAGIYRRVRHLMIPNTDKLLIFKVSGGEIKIDKQTRDIQ
ncbi:hypothetical protein CAEBREN_15611 [Caenorhabditis brenneri]|uniref:DUF38 domain-containing protein n=1 Tax=Caenorhabditis brenneri TaxID=135651 RepID=G0NZB9_CAEBE|nr:hypothetical protein CAEBREN_15611 [Caenorhabditis brenneri]